MENNSTFGFYPYPASEYQIYITLSENNDNPPYHRSHEIVFFSEKKNIGAYMFFAETESARNFYSYDIVDIVNTLCPSIRYPSKSVKKNYVEKYCECDNLQQVLTSVEALMKTYKKEFSLKEWEEAANNYKSE